MTWEYMRQEYEWATCPYDELDEEPTEFDPFGAELRDELIEQVELAAESAMCELGAFGCIGFEDATSQAEFDEGGCEPFWAFACDLYDEPRPYVALDLY